MQARVSLFRKSVLAVCKTLELLGLLDSLELRALLPIICVVARQPTIHAHLCPWVVGSHGRH